jgi:symplekin
VTDLSSQITEATQFCLDLRNIFKQEVLAVVLQQLVDVVPLPALFMRTVIHTANKFPKLIKSGFIPNILSNLVRKQVWQHHTLWEGFIRCCKQIAPFSFSAIITLPRTQLEELLRSIPDVREELGKFVTMHSKTVPKATQQMILDSIAASAPGTA